MDFWLQSWMATELDKGSQQFIEDPLSQFAGRSYANLGTVRYFTRACFKIESRNIDLIQRTNQQGL